MQCLICANELLPVYGKVIRGTKRDVRYRICADCGHIMLAEEKIIAVKIEDCEVPLEGLTKSQLETMQEKYFKKKSQHMRDQLNIYGKRDAE